MLLINDVNDPTLVGILETKQDFLDIKTMVNNMNQDLRDSGFERHQCKAIKKGKKAYIKPLQPTA